MTIGEQIEQRQPLIYNFLIDLFGLSMKKTDRVEPDKDEILEMFGVPKELFDTIKCSAEFRYFKKMMEERKGVKQ